MKKLLLLVMFALFAESNTENMLHYDKVDLTQKELTQKKINATYLKGIEITREVLSSLKKEGNLSKDALLEECNESLYIAIFKDTIIYDFNPKETEKQFLKDCKNIATKIK